jgi:streptogramin lyase
VSEYTVPSATSLPVSIAAGPDGNLWFTEESGNNIGRVTPSGIFAEFPVPTASSSPFGITAGPDGNLWFTENTGAKVGRLTPSGDFTEFPVAGGTDLRGITAGPDGNLWFTSEAGNFVARVTTAGAVTEYTVPTANAGPVSIATGPDGNLWFTEFTAGNVASVNPSGTTFHEYPVPTAASNPSGLTAGPDGNVWFTESNVNMVASVNTSGTTFHEYVLTTAASHPRDITAGPDGRLWLTETSGNNAAAVSTAGAITEYPIPTAGSNPFGIATGLDGNVWLTEFVGNKIARVQTGAATSPPTLAVTTTADLLAAPVTACPATQSLPCSLRRAIAVANANPGSTITIPAGDYARSPTYGELLITANTTVNGATAGTTFIDGATGSRVLEIDAATVAISDVTVRNGDTPADRSGSGGGILSKRGTVTLVDSTVSGNTAFASGGGLDNFAGAMTLMRTRVNGNSVVRGAVTGAQFDGGGGGIATDDGPLTLTDSTVSGNQTTTSVGLTPAAALAAALGGGGIANAFGAVTLIDTSISGNSASDKGGGINQLGGINLQFETRVRLGSLTMVDTTVSGNNATAGGGGIYNFGRWCPAKFGCVPTVAATVTVTNSTISGNATTAPAGNPALNTGGGGLETFSEGQGLTPVTLTNATISGNTDALGAASGIANLGAPPVALTNSILANDSANNCEGAVTSNGHNLDTGVTCLFTATGDKQGPAANPVDLGPLHNNGGPTQTQALLPGSPAIDAGDNATCAAAPVSGVDQRGFPRFPPGDTVCDMGAYELMPLHDLTASDGTPISGAEGAPVSGTVATFANTSPGDFTATIDWGDGTPTATGTITAPVEGPTYRVSGSHTYAEEGSYTITVTLADQDDTDTATAHDTASIADAALTGGAVPALSATEGIPFTSPVATFTDADPLGSVSDFTAAIDWGDGSGSSGGTVTQPGGVGTTFDVSGSHTYAQETSGTSRTTTVTITDHAATATPLGSAAIHDQPPSVVLSASNATSVAPSSTSTYTYTVTEYDDAISAETTTCGTGATRSNDRFDGATKQGSFTCTFGGPGATTASVFVSNSDATQSNTSTQAISVRSRPNVNQTATTVTSSVNPSVYGQPVSFTATVTPNPGGGDIQFSVDGSNLSSAVPLDPGTGQAASEPISTLSVGDHVVVAEFSGSAPGFASSDGSLAGGQVVNKAATTTVVTSSADPSNVGGAVTYTATVGVTPPGADLTPGGTVAFTDNGTVLPSCAAVGLSASTASCTTAYPSAGSHDIVATYTGDANLLPSSGSLTQAVHVSNNVYTPLPSPIRLLDTRSGAPLAAGGTVTITVAGGNTGVPIDASAVVLNLTSADNAAPGFLQIYPTGGSTSASAVNAYFVNDLTSTMVTVPAGSNGQVTVLSSAPSDVVVDESGYYAKAGDGTTAGRYNPLPPSRLTDTRAGSGQPHAGETLPTAGVVRIQVAGLGGVPASGARAAVVNLTAVDDPAPGFLQAYSGQRPTNPQTSSVNFNGNHVRFAGDPCPGNAAGLPQGCDIAANRAIVLLDSGGGFNVYTNQGPVDLVVDVNGWFTDATASTGQFLADTPVTRVHDTRSAGDTIVAGGTLSVPLTEAGSPIPAGAGAAVLTVTIDKTIASTASHPFSTGPGTGFLTIFPGIGGAPPLASDLNFAAGSIVPAEVYATLGADGSISIFNGSPAPIDVIIDVYGYFGP